MSYKKNPRPYGRGFVFRFVSRFARSLISLYLQPVIGPPSRRIAFLE